jgi:hypothetical protein
MEDLSFLKGIVPPWFIPEIIVGELNARCFQVPMEYYALAALVLPEQRLIVMFETV